MNKLESMLEIAGRVRKGLLADKTFSKSNILGASSIIACLTNDNIIGCADTSKYDVNINNHYMNAKTRYSWLRNSVLKSNQQLITSNSEFTYEEFASLVEYIGNRIRYTRHKMNKLISLISLDTKITSGRDHIIAANYTAIFIETIINLDSSHRLANMLYEIYINSPSALEIELDNHEEVTISSIDIIYHALRGNSHFIKESTKVAYRRNINLDICKVYASMPESATTIISKAYNKEPLRSKIILRSLDLKSMEGAHG